VRALVENVKVVAGIALLDDLVARVEGDLLQR
jgi:hypothetical protein